MRYKVVNTFDNPAPGLQPERYHLHHRGVSSHFAPLPSYIYIEQQWRHQTTLSQSNIIRKSLTHIHFYPRTHARRACKLLTDYNQKILTFHSIYDYFALLKAFTNTLNFYQYFKDKLSSHQPSHMHNTRHRTNSNFNTILFIP